MQIGPETWTREGPRVTLSVRISVLRQRLDQLIDHTATAWPADRSWGHIRNSKDVRMTVTDGRLYVNPYYIILTETAWTVGHAMISSKGRRNESDDHPKDGLAIMWATVSLRRTKGTMKACI